MPKERIIIQVVIFASILFAILSGVVISFIFLYQKKKRNHQAEIEKMEQDYIKEMLSSQVEIQEQTLQHIASELHDNFNTSLSVINLNLAALMPKMNESIREPVSEIKQMVKQLMADMKMLSISLNSDHIAKIGFVKSLEKYFGRIIKSGLYETNFLEAGDKYQVPEKTGTILFRMCQEILNNIIKHAEAKKIFIRITYYPEYLAIELADDGKGFNTDDIDKMENKKESTGLANLYNRASVIDAKLQILSNPGNGTKILISVKK